MTPASRGALVGLLPWIAAALLLAVGLAYFAQHQHLRSLERRQLAGEVAAAYGHQVERRIAQLLSATSLLTAIVDGTHDAAVVDRGIAAARAQYAHLGVVDLAIVTASTAPSQTKSPVQPKSRSARLFPLGPPEITFPDGRLLASQRILVGGGSHDGQFWGTVEASIDMSSLRSETLLKESTPEPYSIRLAHLGRDGSESRILIGNGPAGGPADEAVARAVGLSNGDQFIVQVLPRYGWQLDAFYFAELSLVVAAALLLGIFLHVVLRHPELFRHPARFLPEASGRDSIAQLSQDDARLAAQVAERLDFLSNHDSLTGLPNRARFTERLELAISQADDGRHVAVLLLDLDRFSLINESLGHSMGDLVLQETADRLRLAVGNGDHAARMGGDTFALVLPDIDSTDQATSLASTLMQSLAQGFKLSGHEVFTTASIGISVFPEDGRDVATLIKNANQAMYRAMEEGRNTYRFYHQEMNARSSERMNLDGDLRHALDRGELVMHYQPFIDSGTGQIVGAEALLRWHRPGIGFISPAAFIPMLEDNGLIVPVGEWILRTACNDNLVWRQQGFPDLFVAVNFSAVQLGDEAIEGKVSATLGALGFDPKYLEIELTEGMIMRNTERGIRTLNGLKAIGTRLSIDDFGTGYSSLAYLKRLPIDTLKIDRSFIADVPHEPEATAIVQAIVSMGHSLGLRIIAEGVQNEAQINWLRQVRCDLLQGFHFSVALDQNAFIELLRAKTKPWPPVA